MTVDLLEENGVWIAHGPKEWNGHYYVYEIMVFHPLTQNIEISIANDPYSRGLVFIIRLTIIRELFQLMNSLIFQAFCKW